MPFSYAPRNPRGVISTTYRVPFLTRHPQGWSDLQPDHPVPMYPGRDVWSRVQHSSTTTLALRPPFPPLSCTGARTSQRSMIRSGGAHSPSPLPMRVEEPDVSYPLSCPGRAQPALHGWDGFVWPWSLLCLLPLGEKDTKPWPRCHTYGLTWITSDGTKKLYINRNWSFTSYEPNFKVYQCQWNIMFDHMMLTMLYLIEQEVSERKPWLKIFSRAYFLLVYCVFKLETIFDRILINF